MNYANHTDTELLEAAARDENAFAEFYDRYEAPLLAYLVRLAGEPDVAADVAAEVFAALLQAICAGTPIQHPRGWIYAVARNQLANAARRSAVDSRAREELKMRPIELSAESLDGIAELAEDRAAAAIAALEKLPPDERQAVEGRVLGDHAYADLAGQLNCSEAVVRKRVSRGLTRLRAQLEGPSS